MEIDCSWMRESHIDWIFKGPACLALVLNLIFLSRIMWVSIQEQPLLITLIIGWCLTNQLIMFCLGFDYETSLRKHTGDQTISEGIQGATGINSSVGRYIYSLNFWPYYRAWPPASLRKVLRGFASILNQHAGIGLYGLWEFLWTIFPFFQGFSVALLYCFLNSEVKQAVRHRLQTWNDSRHISSTNSLKGNRR